MNDSITLLSLTIISMIFSAFFSGMEIAFISANKVRVEIDAAKGGFISRIINVFYSHNDMFISTMLVGNNIMLVIYGMGMAQLLEPSLRLLLNANSALVLIAQTLISTGIILITGEFLPKTIFRINPNDSLRAFALPLYCCYFILYPISRFSAWISSVMMRLFGIKLSAGKMGLITVGELDAYLQETIDTTEEENKEVENEVKIFQNALEFSNTHLRDCMTPRNEIVAVDINDTTREQLLRLFTETGRSKIVVYKEEIDEVLGYIHVNELFHPQKDWKQCLKPVMYAPETMLAKKQMQKLLKEKKSMAIVVDEFGGTSGLVTTEDLFEEIFGEIEDEHDRKKHVSKQIDETTFELAGRLEIELINERYDLDLPESDDYQTLAGFLLFNLEVLPEEGETLRIGSYQFTILKKTAAKIELVRLIKLTKGEDE